MEDLQRLFDEQLMLMERSIEGFDQGIQAEAKRLAVHIRTLLHNTDKGSIGLLKQLGKENTKFLSTAVPHDSAYKSEGIKPKSTIHNGLVAFLLKPSSVECIAPLDDDPYVARWLTFDEWWNETIFIDSHGEHFSRRRIILAVANKDGGAHVDPKLEKGYARFSRDNSMLLKQSFGRKTTPIKGLELVTIRQVAHEVMKSCTKEYRKLPNTDGGVSLVQFVDLNTLEGSPSGMEVLCKVHDLISTLPRPHQPEGKKVGRNDPCPCGSGKKYKKCCGV
ncbi:SEC-C metal-binding domain-containing protein [Desulfoferula mesophila]